MTRLAPMALHPKKGRGAFLSLSFCQSQRRLKKREEEKMTTRTTETTVTFAHPFQLSAFERLMPAGTYRLVTDEEEIHGLSFLAYQRMATTLHTPAISVSQGIKECLPVTQADLDAALIRDGQQTA